MIALLSGAKIGEELRNDQAALVALLTGARIGGDIMTRRRSPPRLLATRTGPYGTVTGVLHHGSRSDQAPFFCVHRCLMKNSPAPIIPCSTEKRTAESPSRLS